MAWYATTAQQNADHATEELVGSEWTKTELTATIRFKGRDWFNNTCTSSTAMGVERPV